MNKILPRITVCVQMTETIVQTSDLTLTTGGMTSSAHAGRIRTRTLQILSLLPLPLGYTPVVLYPNHQTSNRLCLRLYVRFSLRLLGQDKGVK